MGAIFEGLPQGTEKGNTKILRLDVPKLAGGQLEGKGTMNRESLRRSWQKGVCSHNVTPGYKTTF